MMESDYHTVDPNSYSVIIRKPAIPSRIPILDGKLEVGTQITIYGSMCNEDPNSLSVYFLTGNYIQRPDYNEPLNEIAFGFRAIYGPPPSCQLCSFLEGKWKAENIEENFWFPYIVTIPTRLKLFVEESGFKVNIDGKNLFHQHKCPVESINQIHIEGDYDIDFIEIKKDLKYMENSVDKKDKSNTN